MAAIVNATRVAFELLAQRRFAEFGRRCAGLVRETRITYGLRRDLEVPLDTPKARIPISIRELETADLAILLPTDRVGLGRKDCIELDTRGAHVAADIPRCFVAVDERDGSPCYFQWLMGPDENGKIQSFFPPNWFPILAEDEALLENAYTPPHYRGNGIMSAAMAQIAERARGLGCRYVITFVASDNVPSLRGCAKAGFSPYIARTERSFAFGTIVKRHFAELPSDHGMTPRH